MNNYISALDTFLSATIGNMGRAHPRFCRTRVGEGSKKPAKCGTYLTVVLSLLMTLAILPLDLRAQCVQTDFSSDLQNRFKDLLSQFLACSPDDPSSACNVFAAKALKVAYGINDFIQTDPGSGTQTYLNADIIALKVKTDSNWVDLGAADQQSTLDGAQQAANCGRAVIATEFNPTGPGHVALILPGSQTPSGAWSLNVPNSASFFLNNPQKAYVGKGLSYAFQKPAGIEIYARATP